MKNIVIDAARFTDKKAMYECLHEAFGTRNFKGSNLDALHDCLTMIFEPTRITVQNFCSAMRTLGGYADLVWHVFDDSSEENKNLDIVFN